MDPIAPESASSAARPGRPTLFLATFTASLALIALTWAARPLWAASGGKGAPAAGCASAAAMEAEDDGDEDALADGQWAQRPSPGPLSGCRLPPGHPPVEGCTAPPARSLRGLPPGHPPIGAPFEHAPFGGAPLGPARGAAAPPGQVDWSNWI